MKVLKQVVAIISSVFVLAGLSSLFYGCGKESSIPPTADLVRGGQLYDKWWAVLGTDPPSEDNPGYALTEGTKTGSSTWRCKECHGWDYKGKDGAYGSGSHYTGVEGLMHAHQEDPPEELFETIKNGLSGVGMSAFGKYLSDDDIWDIVKFIKEGIIDTSQYIDSNGKPKDADSNHGKELYDSVCAKCHGEDGTNYNFGDENEPEYVGTIANDNPWEFMHKVRFGQPGTAMPSAIDNGWDIQDVVDVLSYAQSLPQ